MALNLATQTEAPGAEVGPGGTQVVPPKPEPAPTLDEISRRFPQLEILECLGRGGMGVVYKARQPRLNRFVALKILTREKEKDARFAERFTREAQALARLNHPNIVTVYDFGEADGLFYLLMEYVDGMSLRQLLQTRKLAPEEALTIVPSICEALQFAHQQGIVHRDIKPENILLDTQGRLKIADFGIAKLLGADGRSQSLTGEQGVIGTPHYMAPEQVEKPAIVDHRADIFSLGVVFYEMLTGELPLGKFAPPSRRVKMDVRLDEVVLHALEKEPERRYQQVSQVKTDVETIVRTEAGQTRAGRAQTERTPPVEAVVADNAWRQVRGPAIGLIITSVLSLFAVPISGFIALLFLKTAGRDALPILILPVFALVLSIVMLVAGLKMKRLQAYGLAILGAVLAILFSPSSIIGLPVGIWALVVLCQRHVREAFGTGHVPGLFQPAPSVGRGGGWKVTAVVVAAVMLLLAIPVGAIVFALLLPAYHRAKQQNRLIISQIRQPAPTSVVQGTVTDASTGQPIAGARVDDNDYATRANRPTQQAWTDAAGHYELHTWNEEHNISASANGYQTALLTFNPGQGGGSSGQMRGVGAGVPSAKARSYRSATTKLATIKKQEDQMLLQFTESHPLIQSLRSREGKLVQQIDELEQQYPALTNLALEVVAGGGSSGRQDPAALDFQLQPAERGEAGVSDVEMQALKQSVKRGSEAWTSGDYTKALALLLPAALKGNAVAQHRLGVMYTMGQGVELDYAEAARWFRQAAEQGQGESQYSIGLRYQMGQSVVQDYKEAHRWFKLAAEQGIGAAAAAIARQYVKGEGVEPDLVEAYKWAAIAVKQPDPNSGDVLVRELESQLTPDQLAEAQRRAREFVPKRTGPADP